MQSRNAAMMQIRSANVPAIGRDMRKDGAPNPASLSAARCDRCLLRPWIVARQAEEAPRFVEDVGEIDEAAAFANDVEQIAMFARGGIGLMCTAHKTEYVAPRVMLRFCDWALSRGRSTASTQHNVSAREVS